MDNIAGLRSELNTPLLYIIHNRTDPTACPLLPGGTTDTGKSMRSSSTMRRSPSFG